MKEILPDSLRVGVIYFVKNVKIADESLNMYYENLQAIIKNNGDSKPIFGSPLSNKLRNLFLYIDQTMKGYDSYFLKIKVMPPKEDPREKLKLEKAISSYMDEANAVLGIYSIKNLKNKNEYAEKLSLSEKIRALYNKYGLESKNFYNIDEKKLESVLLSISNDKNLEKEKISLYSMKTEIEKELDEIYRLISSNNNIFFQNLELSLSFLNEKLKKNDKSELIQGLKGLKDNLNKIYKEMPWMRPQKDMIIFGKNHYSSLNMPTKGRLSLMLTKSIDKYEYPTRVSGEEFPFLDKLLSKVLENGGFKHENNPEVGKYCYFEFENDYKKIMDGKKYNIKINGKEYFIKINKKEGIIKINENDAIKIDEKEKIIKINENDVIKIDGNDYFIKLNKKYEITKFINNFNFKPLFKKNEPLLERSKLKFDSCWNLHLFSHADIIYSGKFMNGKSKDYYEKDFKNWEDFETFQYISLFATSVDMFSQNEIKLSHLVVNDRIVFFGKYEGKFDDKKEESDLNNNVINILLEVSNRIDNRHNNFIKGFERNFVDDLEKEINEFYKNNGVFINNNLVIESVDVNACPKTNKEYLNLIKEQSIELASKTEPCRVPPKNIRDAPIPLFVGKRDDESKERTVVDKSLQKLANAMHCIVQPLMKKYFP